MSEDDPGQPLERMQVRSLMVPPGHPAFLPRTRHVEPGSVTLEGRAWSGFGAIARVEVSVDGGASWADAVLELQGPSHAWRGWRFDWDAQPGEFELLSRATDGTGATQPASPDWNMGGYANNAPQRIEVVVAPGPD